MTACDFCRGAPVTDAASWIDGKPRPPAPCPRCGKRAAPYRLWVNDASTVLVRLWASGTLELATRPEQGNVWAAPVELTEENV